MADPEGWVNVEEQDNEQWVFEIRVRLQLCSSILGLTATILLRSWWPLSLARNVFLCHLLINIVNMSLRFWRQHSGKLLVCAKQFLVPGDFLITYKGQRSVDLASVVQKEALYCAIGRCASRLKESIPFDEWLEHTLVAEAQDTNPKSVVRVYIL